MQIDRIWAKSDKRKKVTLKRIDNQTVPQSPTRSDHAKKLAQISNTLNDSSHSFEQRRATLDSFLVEVEGEQTRLAQELGARLDSADIKKLPIPKTPDLANLSSSQLEKLRGLLSRTLNNRLPASIDQNIESLQELDSIEDFLSRIIDDLKDGRARTDDSVQSAEVDGGETPQSTATPENQPAAPDQPYPNGKFSDPNAEDRAAQRGFRKFQRMGDDRPDGMEPPEGESDAAGNAKSNARNQASHELDQTQSPASQDKLASSPAKTYLIHIRALTDLGQARVDEEEILRTYRKEVESILQKEDIPVNYRKYIKNYFISIGINTEENAYESK